MRVEMSEALTIYRHVLSETYARVPCSGAVTTNEATTQTQTRKKREMMTPAVVDGWKAPVA